jgi:hypothetical protein
MCSERGWEFLGVVTGHELGLFVYSVRETFFWQVPSQDELKGISDEIFVIHGLISLHVIDGEH